MVMLGVINGFVPPLFAQSNDSDFVLHFDQHSMEGHEFQFENQDRLLPDRSDFKLLRFAMMSNSVGERWVLVTVQNASTGVRILKKEHLMATFANGKRRFPVKLQQRIAAGEIRSIAVNFGYNRFPMLQVETR